MKVVWLLRVFWAGFLWMGANDCCAGAGCSADRAARKGRCGCAADDVDTAAFKTVTSDGESSEAESGEESARKGKKKSTRNLKKGLSRDERKTAQLAAAMRSAVQTRAGRRSAVDSRKDGSLTEAELDARLTAAQKRSQSTTDEARKESVESKFSETVEHVRLPQFVELKNFLTWMESEESKLLSQEDCDTSFDQHIEKLIIQDLYKGTIEVIRELKDIEQKRYYETRARIICFAQQVHSLKKMESDSVVSLSDDALCASTFRAMREKEVIENRIITLLEPSKVRQKERICLLLKEKEIYDQFAHLFCA